LGFLWKEWCWSWNSSTLATWCRVDSLEKTLMLGGIGGRRRRGRQRMRWLDGITDSMDVSLGELWSWWCTGRPGVLLFMGWQRVGHDWVTDLIWIIINFNDRILTKKLLSLCSLSSYVLLFNFSRLCFYIFTFFYWIIVDLQCCASVSIFSELPALIGSLLLNPLLLHLRMIFSYAF